MNGLNSNSFELALDITPLLSFVDDNAEAKYFLKIVEQDENSEANGMISDFLVYDYDISEEYISDSHDVAIVNNSSTILSVKASVDYDAPTITTTTLEEAGIFSR